MHRTVAIIGASANREKFGNKAVRAYLKAGWTVYPINPRKSEIEDVPTYASISDVPELLDRVSIYLPPNIGKTLLREIASKNPKEVYLNPGSESPELVEEARQLGLNVIEACSIVAIGLKPAMFPD